MKKEIKLNINQQLKPSVLPFLKIKLTGKLSLKEEEVVSLIKQIEETDDFQKLLELKIIKRTPFPSFHVSIKPLYEYKEDLFEILSFSLPDINSIIQQNPDVVETIRKIGEENYKKFFLGYESYSFEEISKFLGISCLEVKKIFEFTNNIFIHTEIKLPDGSLKKELVAKKYTRIAKVELSGNNILITYFSPFMFRGVYVVDYEKFNNFIKDLPSSKKKYLKQIVKEIELLEIKKRTFHRLLEEILFIQKEFIKTEKENDLKICTQKDLATKIGVSPSTICRLIKERSIILPSDREYPLNYFFVNKKRIALIYISEILKNNKNIKDKKIKEILFEKLKIKYSIRSINYYRNLLKNRNV
ncbi:MAG: hypothetical protein ABDH23_00655 [Endomicrobiia bacterium]